MDSDSNPVNAGIANTNKLANMGKVWHDDEVLQLLQNIKKKKTLGEIAEIHQRTTLAISKRLEVIAADYNSEGRPLEQIQKFTGLTEAEIRDAIERRRIATEMRERRKEDRKTAKVHKTTNKYTQNPITAFVEKQPTLADVMGALKDIQSKLSVIIKRGDFEDIYPHG